MIEREAVARAMVAEGLLIGDPAVLAASQTTPNTAQTGNATAAEGDTDSTGSTGSAGSIATSVPGAAAPPEPDPAGLEVYDALGGGKRARDAGAQDGR